MQNNLPKRKDLRLKAYDYSQAGYYFVTICTENKQHLFGEIDDGIMKLNDAGKMVEDWINKLHGRYENAVLDEFAIMPNHIHIIMVIVGADPCVSPPSGIPPKTSDSTGTHMGVPLHRIIQWVKTMTTNDYIKGVKSGQYKPFNKQIWQRNYYEHVIRNDKELQEIREYIVNNPAKWELDKYYSLYE